MAHLEIYPDGSQLEKYCKAHSGEELAKKLGQFSSEAFLNGAERVEQHIIRGNEVCPKCKSGLRFDLCCGEIKKE